ncbi:MAG: hypothetical protein JWM64_1807 [Frankiales bacterium]|nr:hypothetical protein [Frankiales bacterium]
MTVLVAARRRRLRSWVVPPSRSAARRGSLVPALLPGLLLPVVLAGPALAQESPTPSAPPPVSASGEPSEPPPVDSPAPSASAAPSASPTPPAERLLNGTVDGTDGRAVNALLGFDWLDASGRRLTRTGCVVSEACPQAGYATVIRTNQTLPATGTPDTATATTTWSAQPPPGATRLFLEVYPQNEKFRTDETRYGHAMRHSVPLPVEGPLTIRLPLVRCEEGGRVGTVRGTGTKDGAPFPLARVVAWSLEPFDALVRPVLGWNIGTASDDGTFVVPNLVSDQRYQVWVTAKDGTVKKTFGVAVPNCAETALPLSFDPPAPASVDEPELPPPPPAPGLPQAVITAGQSALVEGAAEPGAVVELLAATRPSTELRVVRTTTAGPSGYYSFTVLPPATTELRVRTGGDPSLPVVLGVRSRVSWSAARTAPRTYRFSGGVAPARAQEVALYLRGTDGSRRLLSVARTGPDGRYAFVRRFAAAGSFDMFVVTRADTQNADGTSPVRRLKVS